MLLGLTSAPTHVHGSAPGENPLTHTLTHVKPRAASTANREHAGEHPCAG